jgi:hypothetical protein
MRTAREQGKVGKHTEATMHLLNTNTEEGRV